MIGTPRLQPVGLPPTLHMSFDDRPAPETRQILARGIDTAHARTVPIDGRRFAFLVHDAQERLIAGLDGVLSWQWLFVAALWVDESWRGQGIGGALLDRAERHAADSGCHSAWLDTFQARDFYARSGYELFGELEDYPGGQARYFMRKQLVAREQ